MEIRGPLLSRDDRLGKDNLVCGGIVPLPIVRDYRIKAADKTLALCRQKGPEICLNERNPSLRENNPATECGPDSLHCPVRCVLTGFKIFDGPD